MGYTLKLSIYTVQIKRKNSRDYTNFEDFFESFQQSNENNGLQLTREELYSKFTQKFIESFGERFTLNTEETKGIAPSEVDSIPNHSIIDGIIIGGLTGIEQEVYNRSNSNDIRNTIDNEEITSLSFYFKIWFPFDSDIGIIMIQSYTETGVVSLILDKIKHFISSLNFTLSSTTYVHEDYITRFKNRSIVNQLTLTKTALSQDAREALNHVFGDFENLKVEIKIKNFNLSIQDFWDNISRNRPLNTDLSEFEMGSDDNYDVIATYKDDTGKQSQARLSRNLDILPTIILPDSLKENGRESPDLNEIRAHTNAILTIIKREIGYEVEDVEQN